jgi:hypothetical protein
VSLPISMVKIQELNYSIDLSKEARRAYNRPG